MYTNIKKVWKFVLLGQGNAFHLVVSFFRLTFVLKIIFMYMYFRFHYTFLHVYKKIYILEISIF